MKNLNKSYQQIHVQQKFLMILKMHWFSQIQSHSKMLRTKLNTKMYQKVYQVSKQQQIFHTILMKKQWFIHSITKIL